jgi:hypothetical protein
MRKIENLLIALFGIITVSTFILLLFFGGILNSVSSLLFTEVSYIISPYTPLGELSVSIYKYYLYFLILFSLALCIRLPNIYAKIGALYLLTSAAMGLLLLNYPMDPRGISSSEQGITHILMVLFMGLYLAVSLVLLGFAFGKSKNLKWLSQFSLWVCIIILTAGFISGSFALFSMPSYVGLTQKIPIGIYLAWILLTGLGMLKSDRRIKHYLFH